MGLAPSKTFGEAAAAVVSKEALSTSKTRDVATFAGGCFWGIELAFQRVPGVSKTEVGFCQGFIDNPSYEEVCCGSTGHAEAVQITYDPSVVTYDELLTVFWDLIDPTALNRSGNDMGPQYRSGIYTHTPEQQQAAVQSKSYLQKITAHTVVTEVEPVKNWYPAEEYHQHYLQKGGQCARTGDLTPIRCYG